MAELPRLLPFVKEATSTSLGQPLRLEVSDASTGVAGHVFNTPSSCHYGSLAPAAFHFDPFGTEFREPGRISHPITKSLPACAGVPGDLAPVWISPCRR